MKTISRKIPATMVTQHPDHASKPYWHYRPYISTQYEAEEAYRSFADLGATEYKWDWEGKLVDESVVERLYGEYFNYFSQNPLGEKVFLTFRLPNPRVETEFRMLRAFINMAIAGSVAKHFGAKVPPLFEVILPLTETPEEMLELQEAFEEIHNLKHPLYKLEGFLTNLRVIPLFESVPAIINSDTILKKYLSLYQKRFGKKPPYMRPYVARSDPALNSGIIPTVLAIKIALSRYKALSAKEGISMYPIIGAGSLPFRGGISPDTVEDFAGEYKGIRTTSLQSAFRYDYPLEKVKSAVAYLEKNLVKNEAVNISLSEEKNLHTIISEGEKVYKHVIEQIPGIINLVAASVPRRRERFQHIGLYGYSRGDGKIKLPRAITFTAALYSIGIPPELIGSGQVIDFARRQGLLPLLEKHYINLQKDLVRAGKFLNKNNLTKLAQQNPVWQEVLKSVELSEVYLGQKLGPITEPEKRHELLTTKILAGLNKNDDLPQLIKQSAVIRKSLG